MQHSVLGQTWSLYRLFMVFSDIKSSILQPTIRYPMLDFELTASLTWVSLKLLSAFLNIKLKVKILLKPLLYKAWRWSPIRTRTGDNPLLNNIRSFHIEWWLPQIRSSNPAICKFYLLSTTQNDEIKEKEAMKYPIKELWNKIKDWLKKSTNSKRETRRSGLLR